MSEITLVPVDKIHASPTNPRSSMEAEQLEELTASIRSLGVLEPLRLVANDNGYRIESGHRRFTAAGLAGKLEVPAIIVEESSEQEALAGLVTNLQREDLNPIDEARAYNNLKVKFGLTVDGVAEKTGVSKARVTTRLQLLELPAAAVELVYAGKLSPTTRLSLIDIAAVDEKLAVKVARACAGQAEWQAVLADEPMRVVSHIAKDNPKTYAILPTHAFDLGRLKLDKEVAERVESLKRGEYYPWSPRLDENVADQAVAAGVAYRHKKSDTVILTDLKWLAAQIPALAEAEVKARQKRAEEDAKAKARQKGLVAAGASKEDVDEDKRKELNRQLREAEAQGRTSARAANLELGRALLNELAVIKTDLPLNIEKLAAAALIGRFRSELFLSGLRYVFPEYQSEEKVGAKGDRVKIVYADGKMDAGRLFQEWFGRAEKPGEFLGRALIAIIASNYADQGVLPQSGRFPPVAGYSFTPDAWDNSGKGKHIKGLPFGEILLDVAKTIVPKELLAKDLPSAKPVAALQRRLAREAQAESK